MFPNEGSLYNWTHRAFGGYWSFFVSFCAWFPCILLMIVASDGVVGYVQGLNHMHAFSSLVVLINAYQ